MMTAGSLALLHTLWTQPGVPAEVIALTIANLLATLVRFVLLRAWVFRPDQTLNTTQTSREAILARTQAAAPR